MARFKHIDTSPRFLAVDLERQLVPGTFEHALHHLIGHQMFAIDGVKLPSNAAKSRSGTRADFERQASKHEAAAKAMLARHRDGDQAHEESSLTARGLARCERLTRQAAELRNWLRRNPDDRRGSQGAVIKSNRTDNDSAKMATDKGVIQGYTGVAAVDSRHQIICVAQAHGTGAEHALLVPVVSQLQPLLKPNSLITADAGYHSKANLLALDRLRNPAQADHPF